MNSRVLTSFLLLSAFISVGNTQCADGWAAINGDCFSFDQMLFLNWTAASSHCASLGGKLAVIAKGNTVRGIYQYLYQFGLHGGFWLGGSDMAVEGDWVWEDQTSVLMETPFWALENGLLGWALEPQGSSSQNCLAMDDTRYYYWDDQECDKLQHPLCML